MCGLDADQVIKHHIEFALEKLWKSYACTCTWNHSLTQYLLLNHEHNQFLVYEQTKNRSRRCKQINTKTHLQVLGDQNVFHCTIISKYKSNVHLIFMERELDKKSISLCECIYIYTVQNRQSSKLNSLWAQMPSTLILGIIYIYIQDVSAIFLAL